MHNDRHKDQQSLGRERGRGSSGPSDRSRSSEIGRRSERVRNSSDMDRSGIGSESDDSDLADLQREGNLGNERNRNRPDSER